MLTEEQLFNQFTNISPIIEERSSKLSFASQIYTYLEEINIYSSALALVS